MKRRSQGFTLVELITVVAISAILITLIIYPLVQSFNLLRQAQALAESQSRARFLIERIAAEIGNAVAIRDNTGVKGSITVVAPGKPGAPDKEVAVTLPYGKIDIVRPAQGDPTRGPSGAFIDPDTGKEDPTLTAPKGQLVLPLAPGATVIRYFISLRNPFATDGIAPASYLNPYDGLLMAKSADRDNLFVLRKAEFQLYVYTAAGPQLNTALFQDGDGDNRPDDIDDPAFFTLLPGTDYNPTTRVLTGAGTAKSTRMKAWMSQGTTVISGTTFPLGKATILTEISRFDMVQPVYDRRTREVVFDNVDDPAEVGVVKFRPRLIPLAQFRPTRVSSDPAEGQLSIRLGEESENSSQIAPDVFTTAYGAWTSTIIRTWPTGWVRTVPNDNEYLVGRTDPRNGQAGFAPGFAIYIFDPDAAGEETLDGTEVFDALAYEQGVMGSTAYPFSQAILAADTRSGWLTDPAMRETFVAYFPDRAIGKLIASFGINELGDPLLSPPSDNPNNLPAPLTGPALSPLQDTGAGQPYSPATGAYQINGCFNRVWNEQPAMRPDIHRFIDLRVTPQGDGTPSPLHPDPLVGFPRARIVAGSEEVFGPDQLPGTNYNRPTRYTRVTRTPGPNQYRINYVNQQEPDYTLLGLPTPPPTYDGANLASAVIQPRYKAGYIELNSDPNVPLPGDDALTAGVNEGQVQVFYKFQFTQVNDAFAVDYDTRQVMSVNLTIRTYPQSNFPEPQSVALKTSATVRNYIR